MQGALKLAPLFFVRPGELRQAKWEQFDFEKCEWRYFVTKTKSEHLVPLANQTVTILQELQPLTGSGIFAFPGRDPKKPISDAALNAALRRMGYDTKTEITVHGFRAMARTILHQELDVKSEIIERQLAHRGTWRARHRLQPHQVPQGTLRHDAGLGGLPGQVESRCGE